MQPARLHKLATAWVAAAVAITVARPSDANEQPITIDGAFGDWTGLIPAYADTAGEGGIANVDLGRIWITDDDRFLFLRFELGSEVDLSENNDVRVYLDTDANSLTGLAVGGIGAELEWRLGQRLGFYRYLGGTTAVFHDDLRFRAGPTVTATEFEVAVGHDTLPDGANPLFLGPQVRIVIRDEVGGDQLPNDGDQVTHTFDQRSVPAPVPIPLARERGGDLRIATYNVLTDTPWQVGQGPRFERQFQAVQPKIIAFQEIYDHTPLQTAALVEGWLPAGLGETWHAAGNADCKTISRYPIDQTWSLDGNLAALIDTSSILGSDLLLINVHLPCCANEVSRQLEIDRIMAFVRDAKQPGGTVDLAPDTPILITGDFNLVGLSQQLTTLLMGDIINEATFGPDFAPDWDGTDLANLISRQTEKRMSYTWRNDLSSFWPGHLDYFIYTDGVLDAGNHFVLYTPEMSPENLALYGLLEGDSCVVDHLLVCADLRPAGTIPGDVNGDCVVNVLDLIELLLCFGLPPAPPCDAADLDGDGDVNVLDLIDLRHGLPVGRCAGREK